MNFVVFPKKLELRHTKLNRKFLNVLGGNPQIARLGKGGQNRQLSGHVFKIFLHAIQAKRRGDEPAHELRRHFSPHEK